MKKQNKQNSKKQLSYARAWSLFLKSFRLYWKRWPKVFLTELLCSATAAITPYVTIWMSARLINELAGSRNPEVLLHLVVIQLFLTVFLSLANSLLLRWKNYEQSPLYYYTDKIYMDHMLKLDFCDLDRQYVHDLYSQILQNSIWAGWGLIRIRRIFEELISSMFQIIGGISLSVSLFLSPVPVNAKGAAFLNHPLCAFFVLVIMLGITLLSPMCVNRGNQYWTDFASDARFGNRIFSFYAPIGTDRKRAADMRIYSQQENVCNIYMLKETTFGPKSKIARQAKGPMGLWFALSESLSMFLSILIYLFVCLKSWAGAFGVGSVTQYVGAITKLFTGISLFLKTLGGMRTNGEFLETTYEFLDLPNNMYQGSLTTEKRSDRKYEVEFRDVSFKYPDSENYALRHVNMKFQVGRKLAVVGMNGSGKTTFIKLLCRLYDPTEGEILLNGIDIKKYNYDDYMNLFSVVFQDFRLAALPIGENVAGAAQYDRERVLNCLQDAGFAESLEKMPHGLDTYLYKDLRQDGVDVSGGEAQKLAIARALYKDAPFIILDEPTAALDPIAEAEIYSRFNDIVGDKTAIYISHRLSSCKFCDEIAVFHEGAVIQQGSHEELVADTNGKYFELWDAQAQYYTATC